MADFGCGSASIWDSATARLDMIFAALFAVKGQIRRLGFGWLVARLRRLVGWTAAGSLNWLRRKTRLVLGKPPTPAVLLTRPGPSDLFWLARPRISVCRKFCPKRPKSDVSTLMRARICY